MDEDMFSFSSLGSSGAGNRIGDEGAIALAEALMVNQTVTELLIGSVPALDGYFLEGICPFLIHL